MRVNTHLKGYERGGDADLRRGTDVPQPHGGPRGRVEDPGDPVGFREQCAVYGAEADADAEALQDADRRGRRGEEQERVQVADQHARQQDHGELAAGRPHHWRVAVLEEQTGDRQSRHDTQARYYRGRDGEGAAPSASGTRAERVSQSIKRQYPFSFSNFTFHLFPSRKSAETIGSHFSFFLMKLRGSTISFFFFNRRRRAERRRRTHGRNART